MIRVEFEGAFDGPTNMGRDAALLGAAERGAPGARVYGWDGAWVSLGRFQRPETALLADAPVRAVVRPTGGKAVLHGHDVTIGLALPLASLGLGEAECRSLAPVYRRVVRPLVEALRAVGVDAALAEETPFVRSEGRTADCFAHIAPLDIVERRTARKVCGCALRLTASAVLAQASVPAGDPLVEPHRVFVQPSRSPIAPPLEPGAFAAALQSALEGLQVGPVGFEPTAKRL